MAGIITTGNEARFLQEGLRSVFGQAYEEHSTEWDQIFDSNESRKAFEVDAQWEGLGLATQKPEGDELTFDSQRQGFTPKYPALTYAKGFIVTQEAREDQLYDLFSRRARAMGFSMQQTKEIVGANVLNRGFNSAFVMTDGDGVELLSTAHSLGPSGGTFSNKLAVDADLSEASLEDLDIQIGDAVDARGLKIALQGIKLIIPNALKHEAQRILGSVLQNDTANNATNSLRDSKSIRDGFVVNHYLTDTDAWFIKTNAPDGMKYYTRRAVSFGEDNAFTSGNMRMKADERYSFGWTDPRSLFGSSGS